MEQRSGSRTGAGGLTLHTVEWRSGGPARGVVVVAHGYAEHAGRYRELARALCRRGLVVCALDLPGHGRSAGRRGAVPAHELLLADLSAFVDDVRQRHAGLGCALLGHSLGGALSALLCCERPEAVAALVLSSPYLRHGRNVPRWRRKALEVLARAAPRLPVTRIAARELSRLPDEVRAYDRDPLNYRGWVEAQTAVELQRPGERALEEAERLTAPLLALHGLADSVADPGATRELCNRVSSPDVTVELIGGAYHELLHDLRQRHWRERIADWLAARLPDAA